MHLQQCLVSINGSYDKEIFSVWLTECNSLQADIGKLHIISLNLLVPVLNFHVCKFPCPVGDCGKIVIFVIFAKFASIANFYGPPHCLVLCHVGDCGKIVIFAIFAKFDSIANFYGPPHCFVLCLVGDSGNIVIFAIFAKFASIANFYGAHSLLCALPCWRLRQNCHFRHICQIRQYRQLLWAPSLLCALPCWRFWQNCHFCHICQIRHYVLFFAIFVVACISGHISSFLLAHTTHLLLAD